MVDAGQFRSALGTFATGVTIVTTMSDSAEPIGITVNSFSSVSLAPPMVLFRLAQTSKSRAAFLSATHAAVHILGDDLEVLSSRFAWSGAPKFDGLTVPLDDHRCPYLPGCLVRLSCEIAHRYPGGDHDIIVMQVLDIQRDSQRPPLLFHEGKYRELQTPYVTNDTSANDFGPGFWSSWSEE